MKEKVHNGSPSQIFLSLKTLTFLALFLIGTTGFMIAQNSNANENATVYGGEITFLDGETYNSICIDGAADYVEVVLENASGRLKQWIITDEEGYIKGLPDNIMDVNFEEFDDSKIGVYYIYHLSYNGMKPLVDPSGQGKFKIHIDEVTERGEGKGRSHLSEPITLERFLQPTAGILEGGPFEFCVGDGEADHIPDGAITLSGNSSTNEAWVVTDSDGNILGLPATPYDVNFDEAPAGVCLVWHLGYEDNVSFDGVTNAADLMGCFELSNPITVNRYAQPTAGILEGGPFEFCVGDGEVDNILDGAITLSGNSSTNEAWVVTDSDGNILGLPATPYDVNFDEAPAGVCLVWHLGYEDNVSFDGVTNANQLSGCYVLSNAITVNRTAINGGSITGGTDNSFSFTVGDETADKFAADAITLTGNVGTNSKWLVTDEDGTKILGVHDNYTDPDFDGAAAGTCKLWHLSYEDGIEGLTVPDEGDHLVSGLTGACFDLSNPITIVRTASTSGKIALYPNPSKGSVTVKLINFSADNVNISLFNLKNSMIYNEDITFRTVFKKQSLDVSDYDSGIYFVKVTNLDSGAVAIKQLVIN